MEGLFKDYSVEIDQVSKEKWADLLNDFIDSTINQTWQYGEVRWGSNNLSHVVIKSNGDIISAAQIRILTLPILKRGIAYITYGPLWKKRGREPDVNNLRIMLKVLKKEYACSRKLILRIRPHGFVELDSDVEQVLNEEGFKITKGMFKERRRTILVDLHYSPEDLRKRLDKKWRHALKKSESESLYIIEGYDDELFKKFKPIFYELVTQKKFAPGVDVNEYERIQKILPSDQRMRVTICEVDGKPVSGSVCSYIGDTVVGMLSAINQEGRNVRAYYFLQWDEILWSKKAGRSYYDLGGINPDTNPSVYHFKAGINGQEVTFLGVYDYCESQFMVTSITAFENLLVQIKKQH
ncbi:MAG: peptidoglycan bridge formation glycyltransferase FemA/FemB family protein [Syntrophaceae bacterium]